MNENEYIEIEYVRMYQVLPLEPVFRKFLKMSGNGICIYQKKKKKITEEEQMDE